MHVEDGCLNSNLISVKTDMVIGSVTISENISLEKHFSRPFQRYIKCPFISLTYHVSGFDGNSFSQRFRKKYQRITLFKTFLMLYTTLLLQKNCFDIPCLTVSFRFLIVKVTSYSQCFEKFYYWVDLFKTFSTIYYTFL